MKFLVWLAAIVAASSVPALAADMPAPNQRYYRNIDLEFSVRLPAGFLACVSEETNHGVVILLDRTITCNADYEKSRAVFVYAEGNVAYEAPTAARLAAIECRFRRPREIVWLRMRISERRAAGCRRDLPDGHIDVMFLVLRKTVAWRAQWEEVGADLITTPAHYRADMRVFRRVLRGIWVHPDGPLR